jgi:hypothetical protein
MFEFDVKTLVLNLIITWFVGLFPPIFMRYAIFREPMEKGPGLITCLLFLVINISVFTMMGRKGEA